MSDPVSPKNSARMGLDCNLEAYGINYKKNMQLQWEDDAYIS